MSKDYQPNSDDMIPNFDSTTPEPLNTPSPDPIINPRPMPNIPPSPPSPDAYPDMFPESSPEISDPASPGREINKMQYSELNNSIRNPQNSQNYITKKSAACLSILLILSSAAIGFCSGILGATYTSENSQTQTQQSNTNNSVTQIAPENNTEVPTNTAPAKNPVPETSLMQISESTKNSVVEIVTETVKTDSLLHQYVSAGAGSGVIISGDGYILTNNHVISNANKITVILSNNEKYNASVKGREPALDIALIKIEKSGLQAAVMGDSSSVKVGESVIAVGNPLGQLGGTVTNGIISALNRDITINNETMNLLQTNAAINPGNSGGGLFNINGELIGIVVAKTKGQNTEGLGFAIPINDIKFIESDLRQYGHIKGKPSMGMSLTNAESVKNSGDGVLISKVPDSSPASKSGFKYSDKIISVNSKPVKNISDIDNAIKSCSPGDSVVVIVQRGSEKITLNLALSEDAPS